MTNLESQLTELPSLIERLQRHYEAEYNGHVEVFVNIKGNLSGDMGVFDYRYQWDNVYDQEDFDNLEQLVTIIKDILANDPNV